MEKLSKIGSYELLAEPFHCDFSHHLFMGNLGNHLLNAADFHSNERGYGMHYLNTIQRTWVLSRLTIEMNEMPIAYERFRVDTWVDAVVRFFTSRNFRISKDNRVIGYGKSIWAMIDTETRQPVDILKVDNQTILKYIETNYDNPIKKSSRVKLDNNLILQKSIIANYSDVDINGHVNSIKYIEHILDLFPLEWYKQHTIRKFDIAYITESHNDETLKFYTDKKIETVSDEVAIQITKSNSEGEIEVCRCKITFV